MDFEDYEAEEAREDAYEEEVRGKLLEMFEGSNKVFFSRQLEITFEKDYIHWVTNRAIRALVLDRRVKDEKRRLMFGSDIHLLWHPRFRYYKREAAALVKLVEEYSSPSISGALGDHGEMMALEGFARHQFVMQGRNTRSFQGREWSATGHDLDFIFERDGITYGVEVKNTLGYMDQDELLTKTRMCQWLGIKPVIVARMLPKTWIDRLRRTGGFALILKYQLYPPTHKELANRVRAALGLPVDAPKRLEEGTMQRFLDWHEKHVN